MVIFKFPSILNATMFYILDKVANLPPEYKELLNLTNGSLGAAGWTIVMTIGIVVTEIIAIVLGLVNVQSTMKLIFGIIVSSL